MDDSASVDEGDPVAGAEDVEEELLAAEPEHSSKLPGLRG